MSPDTIACLLDEKYGFVEARRMMWRRAYESERYNQFWAAAVEALLDWRIRKIWKVVRKRNGGKAICR